MNPGTTVLYAASQPWAQMERFPVSQLDAVVRAKVFMGEENVAPGAGTSPGFAHDDHQLAHVAAGARLAPVPRNSTRAMPASSA